MNPTAPPPNLLPESGAPSIPFKAFQFRSPMTLQRNPFIATHTNLAKSIPKERKPREGPARPMAPIPTRLAAPSWWHQSQYEVPAPPPRPLPPKISVVPLVNTDPDAARPEQIVYQTLESLLEDVNQLLYTPHEGQPFEFRGTCSIIADPAVDNAKRLQRVASQIIELTAVSFNRFTLVVHTSPMAARATTQTVALWMGVGNPPPNVSCSRCEHMLSIGVERCRGPLIRGMDISGYHGQRISVDLRHFAA